MIVIDMCCCYIHKKLFISLILFVGIVFSIRIGSISNTTFMSVNSETFFNLSCLDCACVALMNSSVAWNCLAMNKSCVLIKNYSSNDSGLMAMGNATFFFRELPSVPLMTSSM